MTDQRVPIGKVLVANNLITNEQLEEALNIQVEQPDKRLGDILLENNFVTEKQLMMALESRLRVKYIDLDSYEIEREAIDLVNRDFVTRNNVLPISIGNDEIIVATSDPMDYFTLEDIKNKTGYNVKTVLAAASKIKEAISVYYVIDSGELAQNINAHFQIDEILTLEDEMRSEIENSPIVKFVNTLFSMAIKVNATDIHIEPAKDRTRIRMRIDGTMTTQMEVTSAIQNSLVTRIKIISGMNIAERRLPQDGRYETEVDGHSLDMRISSIPSIFGEKIVVRLLSGVGKMLSMDRLGLNATNKKLFDKILKSSIGMIIICGPTGSGKTTTLYSVLDRLSDSKVNTITVEDPVEYRIDGITQVQVNAKAGLTFAAGLRSILRQDPDIIMVGEIRDVETAEMAIRSSITGHLVLSTIHTNDAVSTISRLIDMGTEPYLVASSLSGIVSQRLVKKLCLSCRIQHTTTKYEMEYMSISEPIEIFRAQGCSECSYTGYKGRQAIFEILPVTQIIREFIVKRASIDEIRGYAEEINQSTLKISCQELVISGVTSFEEMTRITYII